MKTTPDEDAKDLAMGQQLSAEIWTMLRNKVENDKMHPGIIGAVLECLCITYFGPWPVGFGFLVERVHRELHKEAAE